MTTTSHEHGKPAETKPDSTIRTHSPNTIEENSNLGKKIYSKVLTIQAMDRIGRNARIGLMLNLFRQLGQTGGGISQCAKRQVNSL
jgi:hypothetical protein